MMNSTLRTSQRAAHGTRFVRHSMPAVVVQLSRKLRLIYWPQRRRHLSCVLMALLAQFVPSFAHAGPSGAQVSAGRASVTQPSALTTQITQTTPNAIINWHSFSLGANETVNFVQPGPSSITLNRVVGSDPSRIFGTLAANGQVFLVNNAGIYFAPSASVNVGGLVASSLALTDANFLAEKYLFDVGANPGAVANAGHIQGGYVVLSAPKVSNSGSINAPLGSVALSAGSRVHLDLAGDQLVNLSVDGVIAQAAVSNSGSISADGGKVFLTAHSSDVLLDSVINTSGLVRANSIVERDGAIVIDGGAHGTVLVSGTLAASGLTLGAHGGSVTVLADKISLPASAVINVAGDAGGGTVLIGGNFHGAGPQAHAAITEIGYGAVINADAIRSGNGGQVAVWSDQATSMAGHISAKGGAQDGAGGLVEASSKGKLAFSGSVETTAAHGKTGTLLLDPTDIIITGNDSDTMPYSPSTGVFSDTSGVTPSSLSASTLATALSSNNVTVDTSSNQTAQGNITVQSAISWDSANVLTLKANGAITLNNRIDNRVNGALHLYGDGAITLANQLNLTGALEIKGAAGMDTPAQSVSNIGTVNAASISIQSSGDVALGTMTANNMLASSENGNIHFNGPLSGTTIQLNAGSVAGAGNGSGGNILVDSDGSIQLADGGMATLYSGTVSDSTGLKALVGERTGRFRYNSNATTSNYTSVLGSGVNAVFREQPQLTVTAPSINLMYGDSIASLSPMVGDLVNGDSAAQAVGNKLTVAVDGTLSSSGKLIVGNHVSTVSGAAESLGYQLNYSTGNVSVMQKALTVTGITANNKIYDATPTASLVSSQASLTPGASLRDDNRYYTGDVIALSTSGASGASGTFPSKNVGADQIVTVHGLQLSGADAANYTVSATSMASITPKVLAVTGITAINKVYDTTSTASLLTTSAVLTSGAAAADDNKVYSGDSVKLDVSQAQGAFSDQTAAANKQVSVTGLALSGTDALNYTVSDSSRALATISQKALTVSGIMASDKVYDATPTASLVTTSAVLTSSAAAADDNKVYSGDNVTPDFSQVKGAFLDKTAAANKKVSVTGLALSGTDALNYTVTDDSHALATIAQKALSVTGITAIDKVYDQTSTASLVTTRAALTSGAAAASDDNKVYRGDSVALDVRQAAGAFSDKTAAASKTVGVTGLALLGTDAVNYTVTDHSGALANITPKVISVSGITSADKVYDANPVASISTVNASLNADAVSADDHRYYAGDVLRLNPQGASGTFQSKAAGQAKIVNVDGLVLDGIDKANYVLAPTISSANIGQKNISVTGITAMNKVYDAGATAQLLSADAHLSPGATTANDQQYYTGDSVSFNTAGAAGASGTFPSKNVGADQIVTVHGLQLSGADAANYTVSSTSMASISAKALTVAGISGVDKVYDASAGASVNLSGATLRDGALAATDNRFYSGDTVRLNTGAATASFHSKEVGISQIVTVGGLQLEGIDAANYTIAATTVANITPKALTVAGITASGKVYDRTSTASLNTTGATLTNGAAAAGDNKFYSSDSITLDVSTAQGSYRDKTAVADKNVDVTGLALRGADAANYTVTDASGAVASIAPKTIVASGITALGKVYDSTTAATVLTAGATLSSGAVNAGDQKFYSGDSVTLDASHASGVYASKAAATDQSVSVQGLVLVGADAANYLVSATGSATISPKAITASGITARDKVYDATAVATLVTAAATLRSGAATASDHLIYGSDAVALDTSGASGVYQNKAAAPAKPVSISGLTLTGLEAANYRVTDASGASATITPASISSVAGIAGVNKIYDGSALAASDASGATLIGMLAGDSLNVASVNATFSDKNAALGKAVKLTNITLGGSDKENYLLVDNTATATANIARLDSVSWIGGNGDWSLASNWAGNALPDQANVRQVLIPAGHSVTFDASVAPLNSSVQIDTLSGAGNLSVSGGALTVAGNAALSGYLQTGGLVNAANLTASNSFTQTGGNLALSDTLTISQAFGAAILGNIDAGALNVTAVGMRQHADTALRVSGASMLLSGASNIDLSHVANDFGGSVTVHSAGLALASGGALSVHLDSADTQLTTGAGLSVDGAIKGALSASANGDIGQSAALTVTGATTLDAAGHALRLDRADNHFSGAVTASGASVSLTDNAVLTLGRVNAAQANLSAQIALQTAPGGMVNAAHINLTLGSAGNAIGSSNVAFAVQPGAVVTLGASSPTVTAYFCGLSLPIFTFINPLPAAVYASGNALLYLDNFLQNNVLLAAASGSLSSSIAQAFYVTNKRADSYIETINSGLMSDLSEPLTYPHTGTLQLNTNLTDHD